MKRSVYVIISHIHIRTNPSRLQGILPNEIISTNRFAVRKPSEKRSAGWAPQATSPQTSFHSTCRRQQGNLRAESMKLKVVKLSHSTPTLAITQRCDKMTPYVADL